MVRAARLWFFFLMQRVAQGRRCSLCLVKGVGLGVRALVYWGSAVTCRFLAMFALKAFPWVPGMSLIWGLGWAGSVGLFKGRSGRFGCRVVILGAALVLLCWLPV